MIRNVLTRRREYGTYLATARRHPLQLMKAAVPAESYVIHFSSASLVSCDVYGQQPGRCRTLSSLLKINYVYFLFQTYHTMRVLMDKQASEVELQTAIGHSHCNTCIKVSKCMVQPVRNESCAVVSCELNCGFRFHACKMVEHRLLCPNEKVACINAGNGCPVILTRNQRAQHLEICPASVVMCTMEWNRWPVCSQERQLHVPFHVPNPRAKEGQLGKKYF